MKQFQIKPTSSGTGTLGAAQFEIVDGTSKGRLIFHNFNLINPNPQAVEISSKQLNQLLSAAGTGEDISSLGNDFDEISSVVGDNEVIAVVERRADFKDSNGRFLKISTKERKEMENLMDDELEERGLTKQIGNRIVRFIAA
jgi:hypothetical protein